MLAILSVFVVAAAPDYIGTADAATAKNDSSVGHLSGAKSYGAIILPSHFGHNKGIEIASVISIINHSPRGF